ncbi:MAG: MalY/PatB family protein [Sedimentibacter sp.]
MKYNFDEIIDRKNSNAMNTDGFREYIFHADDSMKFPFKDDEFIRMWIADMEFATPPFIIDGIKKRLDKRTFGYTKVFDSEFYKAYARWTNKYYDFEFNKKDIVFSHGIIPALYELVEYICKTDEKVLILTPSYAYFKHAADFNKRELVCSDLKYENGDYSINFEDFEEKAKDEKTTLCIFCNPHNPSGRMWTKDELEKVGNICLENNLWIISDEIHCDLIRSDKKHIPLAKVFPSYDKIVTCMSTSKTFNTAGLMFSNIIIPNNTLMAIWKKRHYGFENPLSIAAAQAAYEEGDEWLAQLKEYLDDSFKFVKDFLEKNLPKAKFKIPDATYLAWVDLSEYLKGIDDIPLFFANKAGVLLEGGNMFVRNSEGFVRLNLTCPRKTLEEGLNRITKAVNEI